MKPTDTMEIAIIHDKNGRVFVVDATGDRKPVDDVIAGDMVSGNTSKLTRAEILLLVHALCHSRDFRREMCNLLHSNYPELNKH